MEEQNHKIYSCRDEQIRVQLTKDEVIHLIGEAYHQGYNPNLPNFDVWDQLLACEAVAEATPVKEDYFIRKEVVNENASVNGNGNDSIKRQVNFELTQSKLLFIAKLKECNYLTSPKIIAKLLEELFFEWKSVGGHWLYIAQQYTPKAINSVINRIVQLHSSGRITVQNPAAYFTSLIKFHKRRNSL